ncbi:hypothetical protein [Nocardioides sp. TF02-7]|uniref:hypothetical protein n=1 Tax=Nocardioides sp. TF02-7 TaxID=2917724 RepID=UPI001F066908|nr:hypothetical protein [Nocardioides sp. TF02-7]UMG92175.1 hypothetical protein MF408_19955 [Nocardioides sp. TF02-7]
MASIVTRIGPRRNTDSSATASNENAVCSRAGSSRKAWDQRARTQVPTDGSAPPATAASA